MTTLQRWNVRIFSACLLVSLLMLSGCGGGGSAGTTATGASVAVDPAVGGVLTSSDGKITITVPAGTLAQTTTITAKQVAVTELPTQLGSGSSDVDLTNAVAIQLGPAGTSFHTGLPARIKVKLPDATVVPDAGDGPSLAVPVGLLYMISADGSTVDPVANSRLEIDPLTRKVVLAADLTHFSRLEFVPVRGLSINVTVGADALPVLASLPVVVEVESLYEIASQVSFTYTDESVYPVVYNNAGDPTDIPWEGTLNRDYVCGATPRVGTYRATVEASYEYANVIWGSNQYPTEMLMGKHTFQQAVNCYDPSVGITQTDTRVSLDLDETSSSESEAGESYSVAVNLSAPLEANLIVSINVGGTAIEGKDYTWDTLSGTAPATTIYGGELRLELKYRPLDDLEEDGDKDLTFQLGEQHEMPGIPQMPPIYTDTDTKTFTFSDDRLETTLLRGGGISFSATPAAQTVEVGENAVIVLTQSVTDAEDGHDFVVQPINPNPDVLGGPVLAPAGAGEGTTDVSLFFAEEALFTKDNGWRLTAWDLSTDVTNKQTLHYLCKQEGAVSIGIYFKDATGRITSDAASFLAHTSVSVTCEVTPEPSTEWVPQIPLDFKPDGFGGFLGPRAGTNNEPEGDPSTAPTRPTPTMDRDLLHLDPTRDYALVTTHGAEGTYDGAIKFFDLTDGTEQVRLQGPPGPTLGALFLLGPEALDREPEYLVSFTGGGGFSLNGYNAESQAWGMTRFYPTGGKVTDIVGGPVDANGRDTGFLVVNAGMDSISYSLWDTSIDFWGGLPGANRTTGSWHEMNHSVSAVGGFEGPALVLVENDTTGQGSLWTFDPRYEDNDADIFLGTVGLGPHRLRCLSGVCVATNHLSDSITTVRWTAPGNTPVIVGTQAVGDGPVGVDLIPDPAGDGVLALTTGWSSNDFTVTRIGGDAQVLESTTTPLTDCSAPGFGHFTDGGGTHVMVSCSASKKVVIVER